MCRSPPKPPPPPVSEVSNVVKCVVCVAASCLHCGVFLGAVRCLVAPEDSWWFFSNTTFSSPQPASEDKILSIEKAVLLAYAWDFCCLAAGVVPFSRARNAGDVVSHHAPIFAFLAVGLPYTLRWHRLEPAVSVVAAMPTTTRIFERVNGWGFVSSLNEAVMCLQKAECCLKEALDRRGNKTTLRRLPTSPPTLDGYVFTSGPVQFLELVFKFLVFTVFPVLSVLACVEYDLVAWNFFQQQQRKETVLRGLLTAVAMLKSPVYLRTLAWRAYCLFHYPSMAKRTFTKLKRHLSRGPSSTPGFDSPVVATTKKNKKLA